jgi:tricorn protease-like protein
MQYQTRYHIISLMIIIILLLTACGGSNQLTYQVTGAADQAEVTYTDADGNSQTETVTLPWEIGFSVGNSADFSLTADNITEQGDISCLVLLDDKELGRADANYYVSCQGSFKKSGSSLSTNFSSSKDVLPDGSAAGPQATDTPVPPTATPPPPPTPTAEEVTVEVFVESRIVFASNRDGNSEIYTVNTDGSDLTRLTDNPAFDGEPTWSPDGERILFSSDRDGNYEIYSMQADGSDVTRLTDEPANDFAPAWSPNGELIAFMTERNGSADIYLMRADGSEPTPFIASQSHDVSPTWSHATQEIAFASNQAGGSDLYISDSKGEVRRVTEGINVFSPNWAPNGRFIAFTGEVDQNVDIYIVSPDGTNLQQVTTDKAKDYLPKWSPDSNYIMFVSDRDGNPDIYITNDSGDLLRVTDNSATDTVPGWAPQN